MKSESTNSGNS